MFKIWFLISELDLSKLNTNLVEDISFMLFEMHLFTKLNIDKFITENIKNISALFKSCNLLQNKNF